MQWIDSGVIITTRLHGENAGIVSALSREHGIYQGFVRHLKSKNNRGIYQPGNIVELTWKARLSEQLGAFSGDLLSPLSAQLMMSSGSLGALNAICAMLHQFFMPRDPHPHLYDKTVSLLQQLATHSQWHVTYVRFELSMLQELGFGLDLSECAATGSKENLIYVSPKSGRAVSADAGKPYHEKLLPLPAFLINTTSNQNVTAEDIRNGLALCHYFLHKYFLEPYGRVLPEARTRLERSILKKIMDVA